MKPATLRSIAPGNTCSGQRYSHTSPGRMRYFAPCGPATGGGGDCNSATTSWTLSRDRGDSAEHHEQGTFTIAEANSQGGNFTSTNSVSGSLSDDTRTWAHASMTSTGTYTRSSTNQVHFLKDAGKFETADGLFTLLQRREDDSSSHASGPFRYDAVSRDTNLYEVTGHQPLRA